MSAITSNDDYTKVLILFDITSGKIRKGED